MEDNFMVGHSVDSARNDKNDSKQHEEIPVSSPDDLEKRYWNWLDQDSSNNLKLIRLAVKKLIVDCASTYPQLAGYTPHGPEHMSRVEHILHRLIPNKEVENLKMCERFYLLASAWLHDVGMLRGINGDSERDLSKYDDETIRKNHHKRAEKFIVNHFSRLDVDNKDAQALGLLALFHRRSVPLMNCPNEFPVANTTIRLRLLAAYLRLADSLDIDQSRSPSSEYAICISYNISVNSKLHWIKSRLVSGISIEPENHRIIVYFKQPHDYAIKDEIKRMRLKENEIPILLNNLNHLRNLVIEDLNEELNSVKNTLVRGSISYFLEIKQRCSEVIIDDQIFPELLLLANNYEMISHPSATRLMYIVLITTQRILQKHLSPEINIYDLSFLEKFCKSTQISCESELFFIDPIRCNQKYKALRNELNVFFEELRCEILENRKCHVGLKLLINKLSRSLSEDSIIAFTIMVSREKQIIDKERKGVRRVSAHYFDEYLTKNSLLHTVPPVDQQPAENKLDEPNELYFREVNIDTFEDSTVFYNQIDTSPILDLIQENIIEKLCSKVYNSKRDQTETVIKNRRINILLYGYSELVIKSLCGFRDRVVDLLIQVIANENLPIKIHKVKLEAEASNIFRIFVCEGQPKTITAPNDALDYHDGTRYATALARRGFNKIFIIPDLAAGSLLNNARRTNFPHIHLVMFGANGLEFNNQNYSSNEHKPNSNQLDTLKEDKFRHSSGHLAIAALTCQIRENKSARYPRLVLVIGSSKCAPIGSFVQEQDPDETNQENLADNYFSKAGKIFEKYGYLFCSLVEGESIRTDPFLVRDETIRKELRDLGILLYNPREDEVSLQMVDDVILEFGFFLNLRTGNLIKFRSELDKKYQEMKKKCAEIPKIQCKT